MISSKEEVEAEMTSYPETEKNLNKTKFRKKKSIFIRLSYVLYTKKVNVKKEHNAILLMDSNN